MLEVNGYYTSIIIDDVHKVIERQMALLYIGNIAHSSTCVLAHGKGQNFEYDMFEEAGVEPMVMGMEESEHVDEGDEHDGDEIAESDDHGHEGFMMLLNETGEQGTITFTATEDMVGEKEMDCFELDGVHYDAGMIGTFVVTR